jgi:hypothetical protein
LRVFYIGEGLLVCHVFRVSENEDLISIGLELPKKVAAIRLRAVSLSLYQVTVFCGSHAGYSTAKKRKRILALPAWYNHFYSNSRSYNNPSAYLTCFGFFGIDWRVGKPGEEFNAGQSAAT